MPDKIDKKMIGTCGVDCAREKGIDYCYECKSFPRPKIKTLNKTYEKNYNISLIENGNYIINNSMDKYLEKEKEKWTCSKCNNIISAQDTIYNCYKPLKIIEENKTQQPI